MNELQQVFNYNGSQVRTTIINEEPWFVAKDVCDILEIANSRDAVTRLDEDEKGVVITDTLGGIQEVAAVNEPGLYELVLTSRKPEAKTFKRWITHEVLPAIRKTGAYIARPACFEDALIESIKSMKEVRLQQEAQAKQLAVLEDKATVLNHRIDSLDAVNIDGDLQQRLNGMIRKYAQQNGLSFSRAWNEFVASFNLGYHTNLELLKSNYCQKHGFKSITTPQYLSCTGKLEDAVRVADKMLNPAA